MSHDATRHRREYPGDGITVYFEPRRCIHSAHCIRALPVVFDAARRPWIRPEHAPADAIAAAVERCPTGALSYARTDGAPAEPVPADNAVDVAVDPDGPLLVRGNLELRRKDGTLLARELRAALCRCGLSAHKPHCDNAHRESGWHVESVAGAADDVPDPPACGHVVIRANGPYIVQGDVTVRTPSGAVLARGGRVVLCRCGHSATKPFCDGTHKRVGFQAD